MVETHTTAAQVDYLIERIVEGCQPDRIMIFGSYARGLAVNGSDVDLLVLFRDLPDRQRMSAKAYESVIDSELPKDIVVATVAEFERYKAVSNTIYNCADSDGRVVYEHKR